MAGVAAPIVGETTLLLQLLLQLLFGLLAALLAALLEPLLPCPSLPPSCPLPSHPWADPVG